MENKYTDVLVISPHPDDAEFGAGGTIAKWTREGKRVVYVVCTSGEKGTDDINIKPEELAKIREKEQLEAAKLLGVSEVIFLRYPDQGLEETPEFRKIIVTLIRKYRPKIVVTSDPYRRYIWHRDHRIVGGVVLDAVFPYARDMWAYPDLLEKDLKPHKVKEVWLWASEDVNYNSDITETFDLKLKALRCHKSQLKDDFEVEMEKWLCQKIKSMSKNKKFKLTEGFHRIEIWW